MPVPPTCRRYEPLQVACLAAVVSFAAFLFYARSGSLLLYGDAVAHINIARRVFDSRTPGLLQLGTVWLPLPHLLLMPFVAPSLLWQSGIGGSFPSMLAFVFGAVGIFRLAHSLLGSAHLEAVTIRLTAVSATALFVLNPNLLYVQATAMTESLYLALFIWTVVFFEDFLSASPNPLADSDPASRRSLTKAILCLSGACLTRYDAWFLAATLGLILFVSWLRSASKHADFPRIARLAIGLSAAPLLWLAYNAAVYRNPLEFANGPYSAHAIELHSTARTHPGSHDLRLAAGYFLHAADLSMADSSIGPFVILLAFLGTLVFTLRARHLAVPVLIWSPLVFYSLSIAYGSVPVYLPDWPPFGLYNVRYGLQLLPAISIFLPVGIAHIATWLKNPTLRKITVGALALLLIINYVSVWRATPICYQEALTNSRTRIALESQLAHHLSQLPPNASFLMYLGNHVGALQQAGIPLRRSVNEGNHRVWMQPSDPDGLWERSLAHPSEHVDYVVAIDGDPVADAIRSQSLPALVHIHVQGQPEATIYRSR